jgi:hypothetical protein
MPLGGANVANCAFHAEMLDLAEPLSGNVV